MLWMVSLNTCSLHVQLQTDCTCAQFLIWTNWLHLKFAGSQTHAGGSELLLATNHSSPVSSPRRVSPCSIPTTGVALASWSRSNAESVVTSPMDQLQLHWMHLARWLQPFPLLQPLPANLTAKHQHSSLPAQLPKGRGGSHISSNIFSKSRHHFCHCCVLYQTVCTLSVNMKTHEAPIYSVPLGITCEIANGSIVYHNRTCLRYKSNRTPLAQGLINTNCTKRPRREGPWYADVIWAASGCRGNPGSISATYAVLCRFLKSWAAKAFTDLNVNVKNSVRVRHSNSNCHRNLCRNIISESNFPVWSFKTASPCQEKQQGVQRDIQQRTKPKSPCCFAAFCHQFQSISHRK